MNLSPEQLRVLRHMLGIDRPERDRPDRRGRCWNTCSAGAVRRTRR